MDFTSGKFLIQFHSLAADSFRGRLKKQQNSAGVTFIGNNVKMETVSFILTGLAFLSCSLIVGEKAISFVKNKRKKKQEQSY